MSNRATNPMTLRDFRASLHGEVILPDDDGYDSARRVWNGMIDKYPAMIIRCANRADVAHAVEFGHLQHLPVAVRGGGHSVMNCAPTNHPEGRRTLCIVGVTRQERRKNDV
jgi:FAD/FMN-containing dehydrogenase